MTARQIAQLEIETDTASVPASVNVRCAGAWTVQGIAPVEQRLATLVSTDAGQWTIDGSARSALDTAGAWLLHATMRAVEQRGATVRISGLRPEFNTLLQLIAPRAAPAEPATPVKIGLLASIGQQAWRSLLGVSGMLAFIGESAIAFLHSLVRP